MKQNCCTENGNMQTAAHSINQIYIHCLPIQQNMWNWDTPIVPFAQILYIRFPTGTICLYWCIWYGLIIACLLETEASNLGQMCEKITGAQM